MGKSKSLLSGGKEKTSREGEKEKEGWTVPFFFPRLLGTS